MSGLSSSVPVAPLPDPDADGRPGEGAALALSGGGYRAMMFHVGALWRLNEIGLLGRLRRISSVSGGSITSAVLGLHWNALGFSAGRAANFGLLVDEVRKMADTGVDTSAVIRGVLLPGDISHRVADAYDRVLFHGATLQALPDEAAGAPRFVINATNIQTSALWRFSRTYMADYRVGMVASPRVPLAQAVAASSAFPPILSPATLHIDQPMLPLEGADLHVPPYTKTAVLSDGGVYDNLGLETIKSYPIQLVSDGGRKIDPEPAPHHDWPRHAVRVLQTIDNQVRSLRKRALIERYDSGAKQGCYWGVRSDAARYPAPADPLGTHGRDPAALAAIPTRLASLTRDQQDRLINWGYAISDIALRSHISAALAQSLGLDMAPPSRFPLPGEY
ncbi:MAG: putative esterase of the alpha-beta hydrolase superfamily [Alphaproteobacteria bacterium]|nr:putative esterase of the alpha-beta hydrolase superfamily [Alphaproteobacteria bacterium]